MAFRWIKENIRYFGGDPNNITAYGSSTGAAMLHMHTMSPLCKGKSDIVGVTSDGLKEGQQERLKKWSENG